jgi:hypothetical protein
LLRPVFESHSGATTILVNEFHTSCLLPMLDPESSAVLRDRLVREIAGIGSAGDAAEWLTRLCLRKTR